VKLECNYKYKKVKEATYALDERHHETKEGTIAMDIEAIFKTTVLESFNHQIKIIDSSLYSCPCPHKSHLVQKTDKRREN
jgi:hypothetical protein